MLGLDTADFVYGNTRLRARRAALLSDADYEAMLGLELDGLLGALSATPYGPDVEAALQRFRGLRCVHEAVRANLGRTLRELRSFYLGTARELVDLLLSSWDVRNVVTLLRGQAASAAPEEVVPFVVGVGDIDDPTATEIARQPEFAAAVQLLTAWRLPTPEVADALAAAWPVYERSADLAVLEHAVVAADAKRVAASLARHGADAAALRDALRREADDLNVLIALRVRASGGDAKAIAAAALPSEGAVNPGALAAAVAGAAREDVVEAVLAMPGAERWREPLITWAETGDIAALQGDLETDRMHARFALLTTDDPLGIAVPIAFVTAKEAEARNVRLIAEGAARGDDADVLRLELIRP